MWHLHDMALITSIVLQGLQWPCFTSGCHNLRPTSYLHFVWEASASNDRYDFLNHSSFSICGHIPHTSDQGSSKSVGLPGLLLKILLEPLHTCTELLSQQFFIPNPKSHLQGGEKPGPMCPQEATRFLFNFRPAGTTTGSEMGNSKLFPAEVWFGI